MAKLRPFQQGKLDKLCGLYAVLNSIRISANVTHPIDTELALEIFSELIAALDESQKLKKSITSGLGQSDISRLLYRAEVWANNFLGIEISHSKPFHHEPAANPIIVRQKIRGHLLLPGSATVVCLGGKIDHWTVLKKTPKRKFQLCESFGEEPVKLHQLSVGNNNQRPGRYSIIPTSIFLIDGSRPL